MKIKLYISIALIALVSNNVFGGLGGPEIKSQSLKVPSKKLENCSSFAVAFFKADGNETQLGNYLASLVEKELSAGWPAGLEKVYNPWLKPNCYNVVGSFDYKNTFGSNKIDLDKLCEQTISKYNTKYLMYGTYEYTFKEDSTGGYKNFKTKEQIPYSRFVNVFNLEVKLTFTIKVINCETKDVIFEYSPINKDVKNTKVNDSKVRPYDITTQVNSLLFGLTKEVSNEIGILLRPRVKSVSYKFADVKKLKGDQKDMEKLAKKSIRKASSISDLKIAYINYYKLYNDETIEDFQKASACYNCAQIHEMIGNFDKSAEMYAKAIELNSSEQGFFTAQERLKNENNIKVFYNSIGIETPEVEL